MRMASGNPSTAEENAVPAASSDPSCPVSRTTTSFWLMKCSVNSKYEPLDAWATEPSSSVNVS